jgi:EAL domain-containing protein (putative c-di-GMP-specific phosphodiesterase class I)
MAILDHQHDEAMLADYAARLARHAQGRRAVHVHLSALSPHNRREHHIRIAIECFTPLVKKFDGEIFLIENDDIIVICKGATIANIDEAVLKLRYVFSEDPVVNGSGDDDGQGFCIWYDLERDYGEFKAMVARVTAADRPREVGQWPAADQGDPAGAVPPGELLDPQKLVQLENVLATMDITKLLRRQPVCVITPGRLPSPVFCELYVSIAELRRVLMPEVDPMSDRWLFQHLTTVLDRRVLALLPDLEATMPTPISININIPTLLSPEFLTFDAKIHGSARKTLLFELQDIDIFRDMAAYLFARDFLHQRNYRICLDGLTCFSLPLIDRKELGVDMLKVHWSTEMGDKDGGDRRAKLAEAVALAGPSRVVLSRCDSEQAIMVGRSIGITMFQGRHVDHQLRGGSMKAAS